jgi:hypothetical protein
MSRLPGRGDEKTQSGCYFDDVAPAREAHFAKRNLLFKTVPQYPVEALKERVAGTVNVSILVDRDGRVVRACALNGPVLLRAAAESAALKWKFRGNFGRRAADLGTVRYRQDVVVFEFRITTTTEGSKTDGRVLTRQP